MVSSPREGEGEGGWVCRAEVVSGTAAVLGVSVLSGLAGVYFEWMLKGSSAFSMWDRNVQLSFYGLLLSPLPILFSAHRPRLLRCARHSSTAGRA